MRTLATAFPDGWEELIVRGTMTLESGDAAVFLSREGHEASFEPASESCRPPGCD